eukprot:GFYU01035038.1.p1 GENE.GFYU01035038.1~~GFYU01035038.1.p1  ORF type:complete len:144 (-),score=27.83 GFYU01035038.1:14-445(-)
MVTLEVTPEFGYVLLSIGLSWLLYWYQMILVVMARKKYDVQYPTLYAPESNKNAKAFNCVQRAHQNTLETLGLVQVLTLVNGLFQPSLSASLFTVWCFGRVLYAVGYSMSPGNRVYGAITYRIADTALIFLTFYNGAHIAGIV